MPCVESTTISICSRSITSMMFPTTSLPISMLELALIPLETRAASHMANCRSALPSALCRYAVSGIPTGPASPSMPGHPEKSVRPGACPSRKASFVASQILTLN
jgi:hypothetical protein